MSVRLSLYVCVCVCAQASHLEADRPGPAGGNCVCIFMPHAQHQCDFIYEIHIQMATFKLPYDWIHLRRARLAPKPEPETETFYSAQSLHLILLACSVCASRLISRLTNK